MSSDSIDKKSPDSQVKAAQAVGNNNQLKYPFGSERIIPSGILSQKSQEAMSNAVVTTTANSNLPKSPKLHAASIRKSQSVVSKKSTSSASSNKKQKMKVLKKQTASATSAGHSDSDDSDDDIDDVDRRGDSQSQEPKTVAPSASRSISGGGNSQQRMALDEWEILEGLKNGQLFEEVPQKYFGFMMKSRKWPMKGWHKRFFLLENGILIYGKNPGDIEKGKHHGVVDIGLSVIACKRKGRRIDVDADDLIYHLKVKSTKEFDEWTTQLRHHRLHRHHEITYGTKDTTSSGPRLVSLSSPADQYSSLSSPLSPDGAEFIDGLERRDGAGMGMGGVPRVIDRQPGKVSTWLTDSSGIDGWDKDLSSVQLKMFELNAVLEKLQHTANSGSSTYVQEFHDLAISSSSKKLKSSGSKKSLLMKTQKSKERKSKDRLSVADGLMTIHMSTSNPNLLTMDEPVLIGASTKNGGGSDSREFDLLQELFYRQAEEVHSSLKTVCRSLTLERERLRQALESDNYVAVHSNANYIQSLKQSLSETLKQNTEYRNRLNRIHAESGVTDFKPIVSPLCLTSVYMTSGPPSEKHSAGLKRGSRLKTRPRTKQRVLPKSCPGRLHFATAGSLDSLTEFYDAAERLTSCSDVSEDQEEEEEDEDMSDAEETIPLPAVDELHNQFSRFQLRRRSKLPSPKIESDVGVWSLMRKNIGKDLSKISMPVSMNEPLNALQRLCEELEYSELLDRCAELDDPYERMVWVAAFAVSGYSSTYTRAGQKPFNPLLGETYECIREDKGWKFLAEQVSHHPPVSTCHCESNNFVFWQDMQVKTKFWGKSMEVEPIGVINVMLTRHEERYSWNKATSCVHNILGGQRWVEHYGEVIITNHTKDIVCKLTLAKSSYWSTNRHEVYGSVLNKDGKVVHHLFGKWNEGIYFGDVQSAKCIWRPGAMPPDSGIYYGFTRFAMELNEIDSEQVQLYPPTDTRFRPDQRLLEEGKLNDAESEKQRLEQFQREMRKGREEENVVYAPKWFTCSNLAMQDHDGIEWRAAADKKRHRKQKFMLLLVPIPRKSELGKKETYKFNNQYWEVRKQPGFAKLDLPKLW